MRIIAKLLISFLLFNTSLFGSEAERKKGKEETGTATQQKVRRMPLPLSNAIREGHLKSALAHLKDNPDDIHSKDLAGFTPLFSSLFFLPSYKEDTQKKYPQFIASLFESYKPNPLESNDLEETPLSLIVSGWSDTHLEKEYKKKLFAYFVKQKVDINATRKGIPLLQLATNEKDPELTQHLIDLGATVTKPIIEDAQDAVKQHPNKGYDKVLAVLKKASAAAVPSAAATSNSALSSSSLSSSSSSSTTSLSSACQSSSSIQK